MFPIILIPLAIPLLFICALLAIHRVWVRRSRLGAAVVGGVLAVVLYLWAQVPDCVYNCPID